MKNKTRKELIEMLENVTKAIEDLRYESEEVVSRDGNLMRAGTVSHCFCKVTTWNRLLSCAVYNRENLKEKGE